MRVETQESQGGMRFKDNDLKIKIQDHRQANNDLKKFLRTRLKVSRKVHLNDHPLGGDCCLGFAGKGSRIVGKGVDVVKKEAEMKEVVVQAVARKAGVWGEQ
nr:hypothetical protein [Tanacetum cinerariifolium]